MPADLPENPRSYVTAIRASGLGIYDAIAVGDPALWIPAPALEQLLSNGLSGFSVGGLPNRTRSKVVKNRVCEILGYPAPSAFRRTRPRFPGQMFDIYNQKSNNLQVWNEDLAPSRRYVITRVVDPGVIVRVKVITGDTLALLDTTGALTGKYQARCVPGVAPTELVSHADTTHVAPLATGDVDLARIASPVHPPVAGQLLSIGSVFKRLSRLIGRQFANPGVDQERNRGAALHRLVCEALGYRLFLDDGQFPDVRHQLLEVKLQTSPTIDLGIASPDSYEPVDVPMMSGVQITHRDIRYAIFYGEIAAGNVWLTHLFVTTGASFHSRFPQFGGKVLNAKLQIPLPADFFS